MCPDNTGLVVQAAPPQGLQPLIPLPGSQEVAASPNIEKASSLWSKADAYYFRSMARLQRLWRVCLTFYRAIDSAFFWVGIRVMTWLPLCLFSERAFMCIHVIGI